ncbi:MAG: PepSY domain-containing protein, partial [Gloeomargaritaceae cyanobacterium C42_A2020_066]|nr:PepSY domain-containing protein [Gloeomargaritaceae cyanobacterium C42_A2020_066]
MNAKSLRHTALTLHATIGILAGLLLIIISSTGAAIVFHHEIDHFLNPNLWVVSPQPSTATIDQAIATTQAAHPGQSIQSIQFPKNPDQALVITLETPQGQHLQTFIDPYT